MGINETANTFHISRNTVRKYVRLFISSGKATDQLLSLSEEPLREMFGCKDLPKPTELLLFPWDTDADGQEEPEAWLTQEERAVNERRLREVLG